MTAERLLRAGALLPVTTAHAPDLPTDELGARTYRHPVLTEPVVMLTPSATAAGDDLVMAFLGFGEPAVQPAVAQAVRRAPGFPGWALIHDPRHARHALDVVKAMKAAGRRVRAKPGHAWEAFDAIAKQLGRSTANFLPSYWEEVGRAFIEAGNTTYASRAFSKAREAEQVHALRVDPAAQRETILEFALRGAVSIKALAEFARGCVRRDGPEAAYLGFRDLCLKRCQGGLPPWGGMLGELLAMAKAAGSERDAELQALVAELLPLPAVLRAPEAFWEAARPALDRLAGDPAWAGRLLDLTPTPGGMTSWYATWASWLDDWGLIAHVEAGLLPDGTPLAAAPWYERLCWRRPGGYRDPGTQLLRLTERLAPRLRADAVPLRLSEDEDWDLDLLDLALELDLPLADPPRHLRLRLAPWAAQRSDAHVAHGRDPVRTAADPRFRPALRDAVASALDEEATVAALVRAPSLLGLAREVLIERLDTALAGGLPGAVDLAAWLRGNLLPPLRQVVPELVARAAAFPVATCLARTLRAGLVDELGWPALEDAMVRLRREPDPADPDDTGEPQVSGQAPFAVVRNEVRAEVIGPDGTVLACDLERPPGATTTGLFFRDGRLLHAWHVDYSNHAVAWSHEPQHHHPWNGSLRDSFGEVQIELPGGGSCTGRRAWRAGDPKPDTGTRRVFSDGHTIWAVVDGVLRELDPTTGDLGRASLPAFLEAAGGPERDLVMLHPYPGPDPGVVIRRDGLVGLRVEQQPDGRYRGEALDGTTWSGDDLPVALLRWPGDEAGGARAICINWSTPMLHAAEGWPTCSADRSWSPGHPCVLPEHFWPALRVRDAVASAALRRWRDEDAAAVLATADSELPAPAEDGDEDDAAEDGAEQVKLEATTAAAAALLHGHTDARLPAAVATVAGLAAQAARAFAALDAPPVEAVDTSVEVQVAAAAALVGFGVIKRPVAAMRRLAAALRAGPGGGRLATRLTGWEGLLRLDLVAYALALSGSPPSRYQSRSIDQRPALAAWCEALAGSGLCSLPGRLRHGTCAFDKAKPPLPVARDSYSELRGGVWVDGNAFLLNGSDYSDTCTLLEYAPDGIFRGLATAPFSEVHDVALPEQRRLEAWAAVLQRPLPPPPAPALIDRVATSLGGDRAMAALLLAGLPGMGEWGQNFLDKQLREALGLKVAEAAAARERLRAIDESRQIALAAALVGDDPAGLWQLDQPGADGRSPLDRLAAAWSGGPAAALPITDRVPADRELQAACAAALAGSEVFSARVTATLSRTRDGDADLSFAAKDGGCTLTATLIAAAWRAACDVHLHQPWDAPSSRALAALVPHLDRALDDPGTLLPLGSFQEEFDTKVCAALLRVWDELGPQRASTLVGDGFTGELRDDGVVALARCDGQIAVAMHAHRVRDEAGAARFLALAGGAQPWWLEVGVAAQIAAWRSPRVRGLLAAFAGGSAPGACAGDPRASAATAVAAAERRLRLSADAAATYLMVLTLAEPTDALLRRLLGWDEARLTSALDEAVKRKLLLVAKRRNAGRTRFLPGGWEDLKDPYLPLETWKLPFYGGERRAAALVLPPGPLLPDRPLGDLYAAAWQRVIDGDAPRYEEVR